MVKYFIDLWFWPVNEMIELVSGMPAPQFGEESSWVWGSEMAQGSSGSCVSFWLVQDDFAYPPGYTYQRLKTTELFDHFVCQIHIKPKRLEPEASSSSKLRMCRYILSPDMVLWMKGTLSIRVRLTPSSTKTFVCILKKDVNCSSSRTRKQSWENSAVLAGSSRGVVWSSERNKPQFSLLALSNRAPSYKLCKPIDTSGCDTMDVSEVLINYRYHLIQQDYTETDSGPCNE
jgi:hypothetical protein